MIVQNELFTMVLVGYARNGLERVRRCSWCLLYLEMGTLCANWDHDSWRCQTMWTIQCVTACKVEQQWMCICRRWACVRLSRLQVRSFSYNDSTFEVSHDKTKETVSSNWIFDPLLKARHARDLASNGKASSLPSYTNIFCLLVAVPLVSWYIKLKDPDSTRTLDRLCGQSPSV